MRTTRLKASSFSSRRKVLNQIKNGFTNPYNLLAGASIILLGVFVVWPLLQMVWTTFELSASDARRIKETAGEFTLYYWQRVFTSSVSQNLLYKPLMHSLLIALCVSMASILLGGLIAWLMTRSDLPGKRAFSMAIIRWKP